MVPSFSLSPNAEHSAEVESRKAIKTQSQHALHLIELKLTLTLTLLRPSAQPQMGFFDV